MLNIIQCLFEEAYMLSLVFLYGNSNAIMHFWYQVDEVSTINLFDNPIVSTRHIETNLTLIWHILFATSCALSLSTNPSCVSFTLCIHLQLINLSGGLWGMSSQLLFFINASNFALHYGMLDLRTPNKSTCMNFFSTHGQLDKAYFGFGLNISLQPFIPWSARKLARSLQVVTPFTKPSCSHLSPKCHENDLFILHTLDGHCKFISECYHVRLFDMETTPFLNKWSL